MVAIEISDYLSLVKWEIEIFIFFLPISVSLFYFFTIVIFLLYILHMFIIRGSKNSCKLKGKKSPKSYYLDITTINMLMYILKEIIIYQQLLFSRQLLFPLNNILPYCWLMVMLSWSL